MSEHPNGYFMAVQWMDGAPSPHSPVVDLRRVCVIEPIVQLGCTKAWTFLLHLRGVPRTFTCYAMGSSPFDIAQNEALTHELRRNITTAVNALRAQGIQP